jgi:cytochrome b involved in lipid metabolism
MSKTFTQSDVASHNKADSLWIIVDGDVYDLTKFQDDHPGAYLSITVHPPVSSPGLTWRCIETGGKKILQRVAGKDASKQFWKYHNEGILKKYQKQLQIGSLDSKPKSAAPPAPTPAPKKEASKPKAAAAAPTETAEPLEPFGQQIPFADPSWYQSVSSKRSFGRMYAPSF